MSAVQAYTESRFMVATGDLKLEGPVSNQVRMLLEENAALQVTDPNTVSCSDMLIELNIKCKLFAAGQPAEQLDFMSLMMYVQA